MHKPQSVKTHCILEEVFYIVNEFTDNHKLMCGKLLTSNSDKTYFASYLHNFLMLYDP